MCQKGLQGLSAFRRPANRARSVSERPASLSTRPSLSASREKIAIYFNGRTGSRCARVSVVPVCVDADGDATRSAWSLVCLKSFARSDRGTVETEKIRRHQAWRGVALDQGRLLGRAITRLLRDHKPSPRIRFLDIPLKPCKDVPRSSSSETVASREMRNPAMRSRSRGPSIDLSNYVRIEKTGIGSGKNDLTAAFTRSVRKTSAPSQCGMSMSYVMSSFSLVRLCSNPEDNMVRRDRPF